MDSSINKITNIYILYNYYSYGFPIVPDEYLMEAAFVFFSCTAVHQGGVVESPPPL